MDARVCWKNVGPFTGERRILKSINWKLILNKVVQWRMAADSLDVHFRGWYGVTS